MLNTKFFRFDTDEDVESFDEALNNVNAFIKENNIKREDIVEYRTEKKEIEVPTFVGTRTEMEYSFTLTYWVNE